MWSWLFTFGVNAFAVYGVFSAIACVILWLGDRRRANDDDHWRRIVNRTEPPAGS